MVPTTTSPGGGRPAAPAGVPWRRVLLPRNRSVWVKWGYLPLGAGVALLASGTAPAPRRLLEVLLLWVVAEHLGYQARYLANDLRDRVADDAHPAAARRRRLPARLARTAVAVLWGSVLLRLVAAAAVALLVLDGTASQAAVGFLLGLALVTAGYELGRDRVRRRAVPPGGAGALGLALPVLACVPLGYGLRVGAGYHAASAAGLDRLGLLVVLTVVLLQAGCVLVAWVLEGTAFLERFPASSRYDVSLERLAHVGVLLVHGGALGRAATAVAPSELVRSGDPTGAVVARDRPARGGGHLRAWDLAAAAAATCSVVAVAVVVDGGWPGGALVVLVGLAVVAAPWVGRRVAARRDGVPTTWLGGGALAVTVRTEGVGLAALAVVVLLVDPAAVWSVLLPAVVVLQWASVRASSWTRGLGPASSVRAVLRWLLGSGRQGTAEEALRRLGH